MSKGKFFLLEKGQRKWSFKKVLSLKVHFILFTKNRETLEPDAFVTALKPQYSINTNLSKPKFTGTKRQ